MTGFIHAAIGAAIGKVVRNKPLAFGLGVLSHGVGDVIPHHDMGIGEVPLLGGTLARIVQQHGANSPEFWGALGAICPDFEHIIPELRNDPRRHEPMAEKKFPTHNGRLPHSAWPLDVRLGIAMNAALFLGALYVSGTLGKKK